MTISKSTLITKLQSAVNDYANASTSTEDVLSQSLSSWLLGEINIVTVNNIDGLPTLELYDSTDAILCFLLDLGIFAISSNKKWLTLDGKLLRDDAGRFYSEAWAWGCNGYGRLGNNVGTVTSRSSPVSVVGGFIDWRQISAGRAHSLGVRSNGTAWAWGCNAQNQLGDNSSASRSSPVSVVGGFTDWCQISAGREHSLGIRSNGTAWAWGNNDCGRLGDGTTIQRGSPVSVVGGFTDWCQISAGGAHSLAVRTNGTAWAWGCDGAGRLGVGGGGNQSSPVSVCGGFTDWCQVSAGQDHSLGLRSNGTAWGWGLNLVGATGINQSTPVTSRDSPVLVVGGFTDWCQISAGTAHSLGLRTNGTIWAWGCNGYGRLGNNSTIVRSSPVSVVGGFTNWCQVSAGGYHSLAVRTNGTAWAWGSNGGGRLGDDSNITRSSPVSVVSGFTDWGQLSAGNQHSLGITRK